MDKLEQIHQLKADNNAQLNNIRWNFAGLIGMAVITIKPDTLNLNSLPLEIGIEDITIDAYQCFGISLLAHERSARSHEILASARRSIIADSCELIVNNLSVLFIFDKTGKHPYRGEDRNFSATYKSMSTHLNGVLTQEEKLFLKEISDLRNLIRHNNAVLKPKQEIVFNDLINSQKISIDLKAKEGEISHISLSLNTVNSVFLALGYISNKVFDLVIAKIQN